MIKMIGVGLAALALATAAPAQADKPSDDPNWNDHSVTTYVREAMAGFPEATGFPAMAERSAKAVCQARANGLSESQLIRSVGNDPEITAKLFPPLSDPYLPGQFAVVLVMDAEWHFCPQYATGFNEGYAEDAGR